MHFEKGNWLVELREQWSQFARPETSNWLDFRLLLLDCEWDRQMGCLEARVGVLGFTVRVSYCYDPQTETREELEKRLEQMTSGWNVSVPHPQYKELKEKAAKWDQHVKEAIR